MEFLKYDSVTGEERELRSCPRIGTLEVVKPLKDARYMAPCPLDDRWGTAPAAKYPVYGKFEWLRDGCVAKGIFLSRIICRIKAIDSDGKEFEPSFGPYGYELPQYLGEGKWTQGGLIRIHLDKPFHLDGNGALAGYDPAWAGLKAGVSQ